MMKRLKFGFSIRSLSLITNTLARVSVLKILRILNINIDNTLTSRIQKKKGKKKGKERVYCFDFYDLV